MASDMQASVVDISTSSLGGSLQALLMADDIIPGAEPSYQLCKTIYLYHPLGAKMAEKPIKIAQSQKRKCVVQDAPNEVMEAFDAEWEKLRADVTIFDTMRLSRIYGISSVVLLEDGKIKNQPLDFDDLWKKKVSFNVLDPLNTAGSLVLSQIPTNPEFNKPVTVRTNGETAHPTRFEVMLNEQPIYLSFTSSTYGFSGRSVYQRALFPLKSYIRGMVANDMVLMKLGLLVMNLEKPGSIIDGVMMAVAAIKRGYLKVAQTGQVLQVGKEEKVETLNMQNVDGAGKFARDNVIKDIAASMDAPAKILDDETFVSGFGEGSEDAKAIVHYVDGVREKMAPLYRFMDRVCMYRAWNPEFFERLQALYPEWVGKRSYEDCFMEWRENYHAEWPSLLIEPESEQVNVEKVKLEGVTSAVQTMSPNLDPENQMILLQWAADNICENKRMFPHELNLNYDSLEAHLEELAERQEEQADAAAQEPDAVAGKVGKFSA